MTTRFDRFALVTLLAALVLIAVPATTPGITVGTGQFSIDVYDNLAPSVPFVGTIVFDSRTVDVLRTTVNFGTDIPLTGPTPRHLDITGQLLTFDVPSGNGLFSSLQTSAPLGCYPRMSVPGCDGCACSACVCPLNAICCQAGGVWNIICAAICDGPCGQDCPPLLFSYDIVDGSFTCRNGSGTSASTCTTVGDLLYFNARVTNLAGSLGSSLPQGVGWFWVVDGVMRLDDVTPGTVRRFGGTFTLSATSQLGFPIQPCLSNPTLCDDLEPSTFDVCHPIRGCIHTTDGDGDAVVNSGLPPCPPGQTLACDDNCPAAYNPLQEDFDGDGRGDACDDSDDDGLLDDWEIRGLPGVNLPAMGASVSHKDIFVEIDWMEGYSCDLRRCRGGTNNGNFCRLDTPDCGGSPCVQCTCAASCGSLCPPGAEICTGSDERNGNDCSCPGNPRECIDAASCGPGGRCAYHSHKPQRTVCVGGSNKDHPCASSAECPGSVCRSALERVTAAFANAPVPNPDGLPGIALHVDTGQFGGGTAIPHQKTMSFSHGEPRDFYEAKACFFDFARAPAFHYAIFGHDTYFPLGTAHACGSVGGIAWEFGNDLMVTHGSWINEEGQIGPPVIGEASTFMHELGHSLGLLHAGVVAHPNYKPNYLSVMNYVYPAGITGRLDFSRQKLPDLNEQDLREDLGLPGLDPAEAVLFSCPQANCPQRPGQLCSCPIAGGACSGEPMCNDPINYPNDPLLNPTGYCGCLGAKQPGQVSIDWNCSGGIDTVPVVAEINAGDQLEHGAFAVCPIPFPPNYETLAGFNDWPNLQYDFQRSADYDPVSAVPCADLTFEQFKLVPQPALPDEVCNGLDDNGNGQVDEGYYTDDDAVADCFDNCPNDTNTDQIDADGDGIGDACDPQPGFAVMTAVQLKRLKLKLGRDVGVDQVTATGTLTLGSLTDGLVPLAERATVTLESAGQVVFSQTLPAGTFTERRGVFSWKAARGRSGVQSMRLKPTDVLGQYTVTLKAKRLNLLRIVTPQVTVRLQLGNDIGAQTTACSANRRGTSLKCQG